MKIYVILLLITTSIYLYPMQSPGREGKDEKGKSSKGLAYVSPTKGGSPSSSVILPRSSSQSPQGSYTELRRVTAANTQRTVTEFAGDGITEAELTDRLKAAKKLKNINRFGYDVQLREILEIKVAAASAAKHEAALALFESAKAQVKNACDNVETYKQNNNAAEVKTALLDVLKAQELAYYAVGKRLCADHPHKFEIWCRYETSIDDGMLMLNESIRIFLARHNITEQMKCKDAPIQPLP